MASKPRPAALMVPLIAAFLGATACIIAGIVALNAASGGATSIRMAGLTMEPRTFGMAFLFLGVAAGYVCYRLSLAAIFRFQEHADPHD
jgi:hypothetical protein